MRFDISVRTVPAGYKWEIHRRQDSRDPGTIVADGLEQTAPKARRIATERKKWLQDREQGTQSSSRTPFVKNP